MISGGHFELPLKKSPTIGLWICYYQMCTTSYVKNSAVYQNLSRYIGQIGINGYFSIMKKNLIIRFGISARTFLGYNRKENNSILIQPGESYLMLIYDFN